MKGKAKLIDIVSSNYSTTALPKVECGEALQKMSKNEILNLSVTPKLIKIWNLKCNYKKKKKFKKNSKLMQDIFITSKTCVFKSLTSFIVKQLFIEPPNSEIDVT